MGRGDGVAKDVAFDRALGAAIKRRRQRPSGDGPRLTQHELGVALGLQPEGKAAAVAISRIESGRVGTSELRLRKIASVLGTTVSELRDEAHASLLSEAREAAIESADSANAVARVVRKTLGGPQAQDNYRRRLAIEAEVKERQDRTQLLLGRLAEAQQEVNFQFIAPFLEAASRVRQKAPSRPASQTDPSDMDAAERLEAHYAALGREIANTLGSTAAGAGAGAAVGGGAATFIMSWVAASATASTGAAISGLSGAAATSATLAWLGGGSLAAGGAGVAGGTLVVASIVTLPALIAAGGVFAFQARRLRRKAVAESERIVVAEDELTATLPAIQLVWGWAAREQKVLEDITTVGRREVRWLEREIDAAVEDGTEIDLAREEIPTEFKDRFAQLMRLAACCVAVLGLPILRDLEPAAEADEDHLERKEWNELVLREAEALVDEMTPDVYAATSKSTGGGTRR